MPLFVRVPLCACLCVCSRVRLEMYVTAAPSPPAPNVQRRSCWSSTQLTPAALWGSSSRYNLIGAQHAGMGALLIKTFHIISIKKSAKRRYFQRSLKTVESELTSLMFAEVCTCACLCILIKVNMSLCSHVTLIFIACVLLLPAEGCRNTTSCRVSLLNIKSCGWQTRISSQTWIHWSVQTDFSSFSHTSDADTRLMLFG